MVVIIPTDSMEWNGQNTHCDGNLSRTCYTVQENLLFIVAAEFLSCPVQVAPSMACHSTAGAGCLLCVTLENPAATVLSWWCESLPTDCFRPCTVWEASSGEKQLASVVCILMSSCTYSDVFWFGICSYLCVHIKGKRLWGLWGSLRCLERTLISLQKAGIKVLCAMSKWCLKGSETTLAWSLRSLVAYRLSLLWEWVVLPQEQILNRVSWTETGMTRKSYLVRWTIRQIQNVNEMGMNRKRHVFGH